MDPKRIVSITFTVIFALGLLIAFLTWAGVFIAFLVNATMWTDRTIALNRYNEAVDKHVQTGQPLFKTQKFALATTPVLSFVGNENLVDPVIGPPSNGETIKSYKAFSFWTNPNLTLYGDTPVSENKFINFMIQANDLDTPTLSLYQFYLQNTTITSETDCKTQQGRFTSNVCQFVYALQGICVLFDSSLKSFRAGCYHDQVLGRNYPGRYLKISPTLTTYSATNTNITIRDASDPSVLIYDWSNGAYSLPSYSWSNMTTGYFIISGVLIILSVFFLGALIAQIVQLFLTRNKY